MAEDFEVTDQDLHGHLRQRMKQRGVTRAEIEQTLNQGWTTTDSRPGTTGRRMVFAFMSEWEGRYFEEKEVTVYYKFDRAGRLVLLTTIARYGSDFPRGES